MKFKKKSVKLSLSDKIASALTVKPRDDIEDDQVFGTKPDIVSRADFSSSDSDDEALISEFRKRNVNLLSEISKKYEGKVVSRKDLEFHDSQSDENSSSGNENEIVNTALTKKGVKEHSEESDDESDNDFESDDYNVTKLQKPDNSKENEVEDHELKEDDDDDDHDYDDDDDDDDDEEGYDISQMSATIKEDFEHMKKQNVSEEEKKGVCVKNQLILWEGLLEMRIHLQRCLNTANQMPMPDLLQELKQNKEFMEECNATKVNVTAVLDKLISLQNILLSRFPETNSMSSNNHNHKRKQETSPAKEESDEEIPSDTDNEEIPSDNDDVSHIKESKISQHIAVEQQKAKKRKLEDYDKDLDKTHKAFTNFRDCTIQKWNDKTRLATANIKNTSSNPILQQISYILSDKNKLIKRTQLKRSEYDIIGYKKDANVELNEDHNGMDIQKIKDRKDNDEYIPEIFDDSDFYHQLLRELIECKSADISDPIQLSRQWIALQQMRSKMKRRVDTKATKGRKIKYVVHNKLVNFMAPEKCLTWDDEATNELYSSLFGKMFEQNNLGVNTNVDHIKITNN